MLSPKIGAPKSITADSGEQVLKPLPSFLAKVACLTALLISLGSAHAALFEDDDARKAILDLRQKVEALQLRSASDLRKANEENGKLNAEISGQMEQMRRSLLELSNQIESLRAELARLRGQDEQLAREVSEVQRRQKDITQGVEDRLKKFEPAKVTADGQDFMAEPGETRDFEAALAIMRKGDFAQGQLAFGNFVRRYPGSGYRPSALFWLGNAFYAQRNFAEAQTHYSDLVNTTPAHVRAPEALLSVANCQLELKDPKAARKTLDELITAYPKSEAAIVATDRRAKLK